MSRVDPAFSMSETTYYHYVTCRPSLLYEWNDLLSLCRMSTQPSLWVRWLTIIMSNVSTQPSLWVKWLTIIMSRVDPAFSMSEMTYYHYVTCRPSLLYEWNDLLSLCRVSTQPSLWVRWLTIIMSNVSTQPSLWVKWLTIIMSRVDPAFSMSETTYYHYVASRPSFLYEWDDLLSLCRVSTQLSLWVRRLTIIMSRVDPAFSMSETTYYHYVASRPSLLYEWDDLLSLCRVSTQLSLTVRWSSILEMTYYHYVMCRPSLLYEWDDLLSLCRMLTQLSLLVRWSSMILYSRDDLLSLCRESTHPSLWVRWLTIIMSRVDPAFSMSEMTYYHYVMCRPSLLYEWDDLLSLCHMSTQLSLLVRWSSMILYSRDDLLSLCRESTQLSLWVRWLTIIMSCVDPAFSISEMILYDTLF